jgi:hypothetical protein
LLPSLQLPAVKLLEATILLEVLVLVVVVIKVKLTHLVEATGKLAPSALPLSIASLASRSPQSLASPDVIAADIPWLWTLDNLGPRRFRVCGTAIRAILGKLEQVSTFHAIPVALGNMIKPYAMRVVGSIAAVAQK